MYRIQTIFIRCICIFTRDIHIDIGIFNEKKWNKIAPLSSINGTYLKVPKYCDISAIRTNMFEQAGSN